MDIVYVSRLHGIFVYVRNTVGAVLDTDRGQFLLKRVPDWVPPDGGYLNLNTIPDDIYDAVVNAVDGSVIITPLGEATLRIRRNTVPQYIDTL